MDRQLHKLDSTTTVANREFSIAGTDTQDAAEAGRVQNAGARVQMTNTVMKTPADRRRLAEDVLGFARRLTE